MSKKKFNSNNKVAAEQDNYVYKFYNSENILLYVGITNMPINRFRQHKRDKNWFSQVNKISISENFYRNQANLYEIYYISNDNPKYNIDFVNGGKISFDLPEIEFTEYIIENDLDKINFPKTLNECIDKKYLAEKLIDFFDKVKSDKDGFCNKLIENGILSDKGLSKAKLKELFNVKSDTLKKAIHRQILAQYIIDNNIDMDSNARHIKIN